MDDDDLHAALAAAVPADLAPVADAAHAATRRLLALDHVVGVGVGVREVRGHPTGVPAVAVLVDRKVAPERLRPGQGVPAVVGGWATDVVEVGHVVAGTAAAQSVRGGPRIPAQRVRPLRAGASVGHPGGTAGTIGAHCGDSRDPRRRYLLSNLHVLAGPDPRVGDRVLQPGPADGGTSPGDVVGRLARFVPLAFDGTENVVDAAVAEVPQEVVDRDTYWDGYPASAARAAELGLRVRKTGRTTSRTTGRVVGIAVTLDVDYGAGRTARFRDQVLTTAMATGGDSGSLVSDHAGHPVGLLFAGSARVSVLNPVAAVQLALGVRLWP